MSVKISSLNTASTIDSGDDINIAGNNPLTFSDWGGGWFMQDGTWIRSYNAKSLWMDNGKIGADGCLTIGYGGAATSAGGAIIAGSVGIGTNTPAYKLQVRPSATFGNSEDGNISIWSSFGGGGTVTNPSTVGGIIFGDENTLNSYQGRIAVIANDPSATTASHMRFYTNAGGGNSATAERMRIAAGGNLYIGHTDDYGARLSVKQPSSGNAANFSNGSDADLNIEITATGAVTKYAKLSPSVGIPLVLSTTTGSNVLIGTTTDAGYKLDVNGTARVSGAATFSNNLITTNGIADPGYVRITNPEGGISVGNSPTSAAIKIALPANGSFTNIMLSFTVHIFDYALGKTRTLKIAGYTYYNQDWYNMSVYQSGGELIGNINVRFGVEGGRNCVWIGETNTYWSYPNIFVTDVQCGHSQTANLTSGWTISLVTTLGTVQNTIVAYTNITTKDIGGTTNYLPKFTGASALGDSQLFDNGTNVGIGTASPAEKLSVSGAIMSTGAITGHGANRTTLSQEGSNGAYWQSYGADASTVGTFSLRQASSDFSIVRTPLHITSAGNVGIGTTSPSSPGGFSRIVHISGGYASLVLTSTIPSKTWEIGVNSTSLLTFYDGADRMVINTAGNVGIGTTSPANKLVVTSDASPTYENSYAIAAASASDPAYKTVIGYDFTNDIGLIAAVRTGIGWRNISIPQGNVLIGTNTNAGFKLDVNGTARVQGQLVVNHSLSGNYGAVIYNTSATGEGLVVRGGSTGSHTSFVVQPYDGSVALFSVVATGAATFSSSVTAGGNYLIANASASKKGYTFSSPASNWGAQTSGIYFNPIDAVDATPTFTINLWNGTSGTAGYGGFTDVLTINGAGGAATFSSSVTANSFIKSGGTSAQFLKADGSVDSSAYITSGALAAYLPLAGGNLTGLVQSTSAIESDVAFRTAGNFELTSATTGLKSNFYDTRFYASSTSYWNITTAAAATGGALLFRQGFGGTTKGYVYWDGDGFGLLNNLGGWSVRTNNGSNYGGTFFGNWVVRSMNVDSGSIIFYTSASAVKGSVSWDDQGFGLINNQGDYSVLCNQGSSYGGLLRGTWTSTGNFNIIGAELSINSNAVATYSRITYRSSLDPNSYDWYTGMGYDPTAEETYYYIRYIDGNQFRVYPDGTIYINGGAFSQYSATSNYISVGAYGLYSSTYSAYFRRNDASSYAPWELVGAKGGYTGIYYSASNQPHFMFNTSNGYGGLYYQTGSRWVMYYDYGNNSLGIGGTSTDATYKLYVNGNVRVVGTFNLSTLITNGAVYSIGGGLTNTNPSDIRLKEDIAPLQYGLKEVMALNPVTYKWKDGSNGGQRSTGLIAQDVQDIMPEYVKNISEDNQYLGLDSYAINIVLINAIKELKAEIEILKNK